MTTHIDSKRRKELIEARFGPLVKQILTWPDPAYSELDLFKSLLIELNNNKQRLVDHLGTAILEAPHVLMNEYTELPQDIDENYAERFFRRTDSCLLSKVYKILG
jgi:hypothetical protein